MWFKNIRAYRLTSSFDLSPEQLGEKLAQRAFRPCAKSQAQSLGWVPPLGGETTELAARGLFGEYALFIPAAFIAHENTEGEYSTGLVLDRIDDKVGAAYAGHPDRLYLVGLDGKIAYAGARGPMGFSPSELEMAIIAELSVIDTMKKASKKQKKQKK